MAAIELGPGLPGWGAGGDLRIIGALARNPGQQLADLETNARRPSTRGPRTLSALIATVAALGRRIDFTARQDQAASGTGVEAVLVG